jgi:hypothetical protein
LGYPRFGRPDRASSSTIEMRKEQTIRVRKIGQNRKGINESAKE